MRKGLSNYFTKRNILVASSIIVAILLMVAGKYYITANKEINIEDIDTDKLDYAKAKPLLSVMYNEYPYTFYVHCKFNTKTKEVIKKGCAYAGDYSKIYVNWEHIFPVSRFGKTFECWEKVKNDKRNYCDESEPKFSAIMADMHNIVPSINVINSARKNFDMAELEKPYKRSDYGDMKINRNRRLVEPLDEYKGEAARAYLYMSKRYNLTLSEEERVMFDKWNASFPPNAFECKKNKLVEKIQGNDNSYISEKC